MKIKFILIVSLAFFLGYSAAGQVQTDTLSLVKSLGEKGHLARSLEIIKHYYKGHPDDLYTTWIYAQVAYQSHKYRLSAGLYEKAIRISPREKGLRLDYAKSLVNTGELNKAEEQLTVCTNEDRDNPEPWLYLARIRYWKGEYMKSLALLDNLILNVPDYMPAKTLRQQVQHDMAPWLGLEIPYTADDQPMKMITPELTGGWRRSNLLGMDVHLTVPFLTGDTTGFKSVGFNLGNTFHFIKPNMNLYLNLGFFNHTTLNSWHFTGEVKIEKALLKKMMLWVGLKRSPYLYTLSSLQLPLFENHLTIAASWNDPDRWNGQFSFEESTFSSDDNRVTAICGWVFAPAVKAGRFDFHFGYGFNYSTSRENNFTNDKSINEIIAGWEQGTAITGIYDPYFTPKDQQIHSLLGVVNFKAAKKLKLSLNLNAGLYATTMYPYLFLNGNATDSLFMEKSFVQKQFLPYNITAGANWQMTRNLDLQATFIYNSTIYYTTKTIGLTIRKRF